jgi:hypothetical protein
MLIYSNPENWEHPLFLHNPQYLALPPDERDEVARAAEALHREIAESGELIVAVALADPIQSLTVRPRDGVPAITDGPYIEAKEELAGYLVVDCDTSERAAEIARRIPDARFGGVEVRPIMSSSGEEM